MFIHTFYTWILANMIHPILWLFMPLFIQEEEGISFINDVSVGILMLVTFFTGLISFPCLLLGWQLLRIIAVIDYTKEAKFCMWTAAVLSLIIAESILIVLLVEVSVMEMIWLIIPVSVASIIAICARYSLFIKLVASVQTYAHEKD